MSEDASPLMRAPEQVRQASFLELFFDLAFVFTLTRLSSELLRNLNWAGALRTLILLLPVWFIWRFTSLVTARFRPDHQSVQIVVIVLMLASLGIAVAIPGAYLDRGQLFASLYVMISLGGPAFLLAVRFPHALRRLGWGCVFAAAWVAGAFAATGVARVALWAVAAGLELVVTHAGFPVPRYGRVPPSEVPVTSEYTSERQRQLLIIALGDSILVIGGEYSSGGLPAHATAGFIVAFVATVALWRIYIYRAGGMLATEVEASQRPGHTVRTSGYAHLIMIAGIVTTTVGDDLVISHSTSHMRPAWLTALLGGPVLFLAGRALLEHVVFGRVSWSRRIGPLVLAVLSPALLHTTPLVAGAVTALVLVGIAVANVLSWRGRPLQTRSLRR
ncbi:low temperature requirement protein A [Rugosimonospora africana]|uniref:Membrane protein n=1 Tax=Rugosimonospora africana TaxID=556532 RepID=A0A8J3VPW3_9ACTN|nr:low temperature requirement protein A [Rugosimonospora africana]GIH14367.1 membrane protein [Rugosimonospora africana]